MTARAVMVAVLLGPIAFSAQGRDVAPLGSGTAVITGRVVTDDSVARPLGRAIVTVSGAELPASRSAVTDDAGRFTIANLPAGRLTIAAIKRGYVAGAYGAPRPGRPGTPVVLAPGQTFDATIRLAPAGVVTGIIRDERGVPLPGLRVFAIDANQPAAPSPGVRAGAGSGVETDDRGIYRIFDLVPGDYLIAATSTYSVTGDLVRRSAREMDAVLARLADRETSGVASAASVTAPSATAAAATLAVVYFPGTASMGEASRVRLGRGEVRDGLDFVMRAVPVTTIDGVVVSVDGPMPASIELSIIPENQLQLFALSSANPQLTHRPGADGRFTYTTIVPGHYTIMARAGAAPSAPFGGRGGGGAVGASAPAPGRAGGNTIDTKYAVEEFDVVGQPVSGITLRLQRGSRFAGRLTVDATTQAAPSNLTEFRVGLQPSTTASSSVNGTVIGNTFGMTQAVPLRADGTFEIAGLAPGSYRVTCTVPGTAAQVWWLRSAMVGSRDTLDSTLAITLGADVVNAVLTLTDRHSELTGTLQTATGQPAPDYFVIVMPADPLLRTTGSRRVKATRPDTAGRFSVVDLPSGDYLLVALTDVAPNEWQRPEFLAEIAPAGVRVSLGEGERKSQDLRISR
jgi:carboxypeptidase family protein